MATPRADEAKASPSKLRLAFAAYLCRRHGDSTFDRKTGEGAELGALAHGHALRMLHPHIESVLLHAVIPDRNCAEFLPKYHQPMQRAYTQIVRLDGSSFAEQRFLSSMRYQPHLWLKLCVLNLTLFDRVMWLGLDTIPIDDLTAGFTCVHRNASSSSVAPHITVPDGGFAPCIEPRGNADTMLFYPNPALLTSIVEDVTRPLGRRHFDGVAGYDQRYLTTQLRLGRMPVGQVRGNTFRNRSSNLPRALLPLSLPFHLSAV